MKANSSKNQDIKRLYVNDHVYLCVSSLVSDMIRAAYDGVSGFSDWMDELESVASSINYEEACEQENIVEINGEWFAQKDGEQDDLEGTAKTLGFYELEDGTVVHTDEDGISYSDDLDVRDTWDTLAIAVDEGRDEWAAIELSESEGWLIINKDTQYDSAEEACYQENIDVDSYREEAYEFWAVSDHLRYQLTEHGGRVEEIYGMNIWGRSTSGQAILLDGIISEICLGLKLLKEDEDG